MGACTVYDAVVVGVGVGAGSSWLRIVLRAAAMECDEAGLSQKTAGVRKLSFPHDTESSIRRSLAWRHKVAVLRHTFGTLGVNTVVYFNEYYHRNPVLLCACSPYQVP